MESTVEIEQLPRKRGCLIALLVLGGLIVVAALIPPLAGFRVCLGDTKAAFLGPAMTRDNFAQAVRAHGDSITLTPSASSSGLWNLSGQVFDGSVDGQPISVFDYRTSLAAYMETRCFVDANAVHPGLLGTVYIDNFQPTYWYRKGNLIVAYVGWDHTIPQVLQDILGSPFV